MILHVPTKIVIGRGSLDKLPKHLPPHLGRTVLVLIGKGSVKRLGYLDRVLGLLEEREHRPVVHEGVEPNPTCSTVDAAAETARREGCSWVLALGGGSVMDAAKGVALVATSGGGIREYMSPGEDGELRKKSADPLPYVCVPTLAGTGSEANSYAVITDPEARVKAAVPGGIAKPLLSLLDPELMTEIPWTVTADNTVDIVSHLLDPLLNSRAEAPMEQRMSGGLVRTVMDSSLVLKENPGDLSARERLCEGSALALCGLFGGLMGPFAIHQLEHALSAVRPALAHGRGLAALFPAFLARALGENPAPLARWAPALAAGNGVKGDDGPDDARLAAETIEKWLAEVDARVTLTDLGFSAEDLDLAADLVMKISANRKGLVPAAPPLDRAGVRELFGQCR